MQVDAIKNRQIITVRLFKASIEKVFSAWANEEQLKLWWGPKGFSNSFHEFDFRPGGRWKFVMHGPNGGNYENESFFVEINEPKRIVLQHISRPHFQLTVDFEDLGNTTRLVFQQLFETVEEYNKVKGFAADANEENMDRLETVLQGAI